MFEFMSRLLTMRNTTELEREVTARVRAEGALKQANAELERQIEELRASEERFRLLVEGTKEYAIYLLGPDGRIASWNPGAERIKQYRAEEVLGQSFALFYPPEAVQAGRPEQGLRTAAAEGAYKEEGWRVRKDGSRFWASVVLTALRDPAGNLRGFSKITRDLTERQQAEADAQRLREEAAARRAAEEQAEAVRQQHEWFRITLASIGDAVVCTDAQGRVIFLNPVAEQLTGWPLGEAEGRPLENVFHIVNEQTGEPAENPVVQVLREGQLAGLSHHMAIVARDGTRRPIEEMPLPSETTAGHSVSSWSSAT